MRKQLLLVNQYMYFFNHIFFETRSKTFGIVLCLTVVFSILWGTAVHAAAPSPPSELTILGQTRISKDTTPTFRVTATETGGTVTLYSNSGCTDAISAAATVSDTAAPYIVDILTTTAFAGDTEKTVYAKHTNAGNESSTCAAFARAYKLDTTVPTLTVGTPEGSGDTRTITTSYADTHKSLAADFNVNALLNTLKISDNSGGDGELDIDLDQYDYFGSSIALDGTTLAVGVPNDDDGGTSRNKGAVYLFTKENNTWTQTLKISDNGGGGGKLDIDLDNNDRFGNSVALDGTTLAVGAWKDDDGGTNSDRGAVYLFTKDTNGIWTQTLKISDNGGGDGKLNVDLGNRDTFGSPIALDGTTLAVGATGDDDGGTNSNRGAVYLFTKGEDGAWTQTLKISDNGGGDGKLNIDLDQYDYFGSSIALDGTTLAVGASVDDDGGANSNRGAVYLFTKGEDGAWTQTLKISDNGGGAGKVAIDLDNDDLFGTSVALDGNTLIVGAWGDDGDGGTNKGAVYLFTKESGIWTQTLKISDNGGGDGELDVDLINGDNFGYSVALDGTILVVGAQNVDTYKGGVYLFDASAMRYLTQTESSCSTAPPQNSLPHVGPAATFTAADNDKYVCFWATDKAGNINKRVSTSLGTIPALLTATFGATWIPNTLAISKTLAVSEVTTGAAAEYKFLGPTDPCTAAAYSASTFEEVSLPLSTGAGSITVSDDAHNTKYACVKLSKANRTNRYLRSPTITDIDTTAPTVTDTTYYADVGLRTVLDTEFLTTGATIYTNIIFSENVKNVLATGITARPEISYSIGSTKTQYNIVAHGGTLSSGQCKAKSASDTSEYTCLYTVVAGNDGAFKTTVGIKTEDMVGHVFSLADEDTAPFQVDAVLPVLTVGTPSGSGDTRTITTTYADTNKSLAADFNVNALLKTLTISDNGSGDGKLDIDLDNSDLFGTSVALDGNTLVVGVPRDDDGANGNNKRGAVYLFTKESNIWTQTLKNL